MRFIGEYIQDLVSRFRNLVIIEDHGVKITNSETTSQSENITFEKQFGSGSNGDLANGNNLGSINFNVNNSSFNGTSLNQIVSTVNEVGANPTGIIRIRAGAANSGSNPSFAVDGVVVKGNAASAFRTDVDLLSSAADGLLTINGDTKLKSSSAAKKITFEHIPSGSLNASSALGHIQFVGKTSNSTPGTPRFGQILCQAKQPGTDSVDSEGRMTFQVLQGVQELTGLSMFGAAPNRVDTTINHGPDAQATINGDVILRNDTFPGSNDATAGMINFNARGEGSLGTFSDFAQIHAKTKVAGVDASSFKQGELSLNVLSDNSLATGLKIEARNGLAGATEVTIGSSTTSKVNIIGDDFEVPDLTIKDLDPVLRLHDSSTSVTQGNLIGQIVWHNSENNSDTLKIIGQSVQSFSPSVGGSKFQFWVTQAGSTTPWRALTIDNDRSLDCANNVTIDGTGNLILKQNAEPEGQYSATINVPALSSDITLTTPTTTGTLALTSSDITGNAATASSATSAGICKNVVGNTDTDVNILSDKSVIVTIDADNDTTNNFKVNNSAGTLFTVLETGSINFSGTALTNVNTGATQLDIQTDGNVNFTIDRSNTTTGNYFSFINYNQEIARLDESGNLRLEGSQLSNSATANNFDIISSRVLKLQHAGSYDIQLGNSTNQDVLKVEGNAEKVTVNGALNTTGLITGKQRQVYSQSFFDDLGTTKHYIPWKSVNEQTTIYQEESAMVMPCDGRIVSVSVRVQFPNANGDITIGVHTCPVNVSTFVNNFTNNWIEEETELLPLAGTDDNHLFHFTFDNAKHFESSELCAISIQCSQDVTPSLAYWHVTTVVEYDWNTFLGTTSAEIESTP